MPFRCRFPAVMLALEWLNRAHLRRLLPADSGTRGQSSTGASGRDANPPTGDPIQSKAFHVKQVSSVAIPLAVFEEWESSVCGRRSRRYRDLACAWGSLTGRVRAAKRERLGSTAKATGEGLFAKMSFYRWSNTQIHWHGEVVSTGRPALPPSSRHRSASGSTSLPANNPGG